MSFDELPIDSRQKGMLCACERKTCENKSVRVFVEGSILSCTYVGKMCCDNEYSHKLVLQAQHSLTLAAHYFNKPLLASR